MTSALRGKPRDLIFTFIVVVVWGIAFGVYLVNRPDASVGGLSMAYAYSLVWWAVAMIIFTIYFIIDARGG